VTNFSQGGNTAKDALRLLRLTKTLHLYDLVLVAVGLNDATQEVSIRSFQRSLRAIVKRARREGCDVLLVSPCVPTVAPVDLYRDALDSLADGETVGFADVTTAWKIRGGEHLLANGVNHPTEAGHRLYAAVLLDLFETCGPSAPAVAG
jgi:lysophospholipase L1-like esterase